MKKLFLFALSLMLVAPHAQAKLSIGDTNVPIVQAGKALYIENNSGNPVRVLEVDSSGAIEIDNGTVGASFSGTLTVDGATTFSADPTFSSATTDKPDVAITNTNADATGVDLILKKDSASPADNDVIGEIQFYSDDSTGTSDLFAEIEVQAEDVTTASEDTSMSFQTIQAGSLAEILRLDTAATIDGHYKIDGAAITSLTDNDSTITAFAGKGVVIESVDFDGGVVTGVTSLTASATVDALKVLTEKVVLDTVQTFTDSDATPDVGGYSYFNTNTSGVTITDFDGAGIEDGQLIYVVSKGAIVYDVTSSGIKGGTADITTAAGDLTVFLYDGTDWIVVSRMDMSDDLN